MVAANDVVKESVKKKEETKEELGDKIDKLTVSYLNKGEQSKKHQQKKPDKYGWGTKQEKSGYSQKKKDEGEKEEKKTKKDKRFGGAPKCPICGKSVYFAEKLVALGETFHKKCFACNECKKTLGTAAEANDGQGLIYCKGCYAKKHGPKGIGFGTLVDTGIDKAALKKDI